MKKPTRLSKKRQNYDVSDSEDDDDVEEYDTTLKAVKDDDDVKKNKGEADKEPEKEVDRKRK